MFVDFFIKRPVFATVISLIILLAGSIVIPTLPVALYPNIVPPQVSVTSQYTGANSQVVESGVTIPLEQVINGVEGMKYMTSTSGNDGTSNITITFDRSRDIDRAAVDVQNRVNAAMGRLPDAVKQTGISIQKNSSAIIMAIGLYSDNNRYDNFFISNYADRFIKEPLSRLPGVGEAGIRGERKYAMRLWLDPNRMAARKLTASDVVQALREQNVQVAAGQVGQAPTAPGQAFQMSVRATGRLLNADEFNDLILKEGPDGSLVHLSDVGRAELGAEDYGTFLRFSGHDAVGMLIRQLPNANALDVDKAVRAELARLEKQFPPGLHYKVAFDSTTVVGESIHEVIMTLVEAIALVILVMFVFLQNWRTTLIPAFTIPVSLVGTFIFVKLMGFSINTLTMFGLTLATGLVVDDAIVVIENIARFMSEKKLDAKTAASQAMKEVFSAVIAISLVLVSVFVPVAFFPGTTGQLYQQFALTITFSVLLSTLNALTLTPALSALLLKGSAHGGDNRFFRWTNKIIDGITNAYHRLLKQVLAYKALALAAFAALLVATYALFQIVPGGFIPPEDQGYFMINIQGPEGASVEYTRHVLEQVEAKLRKIPELQAMFAIGGFGFTGNGSNKAMVFPNLKPTHERMGREHSVKAVIERIRGELAGITDATVVPFEPPAIQGLGNFGGFEYQLQDRSNQSLQTLANVTQQVSQQGNATPGLTGLFSSFTANDPQIMVDINRQKARALHVPLDEIFSTLQVFLGSQYVNDFDYMNRVYRVYAQADMPFRNNPKNIRQFYVRSTQGDMIPMDSLVSVKSTVAPQTITHYNLFRSTTINGSAAPGFSSSQAMTSMEQLSRKVLPPGMDFSWSGISLEQLEGGNMAGLIFTLGLVFVFLVLAAQYESFVDPLIVILSVPLAILGALLFQSLRGLENDVYCQIGLVMLIGLASKNAILIVEFANELYREGRNLHQAVMEAARIRFRPIVMTSLAFILGVLPLVLAEGSGAASRNSLGTAVFGGMLVSTVLSLFIVPVLYVTIGSIREQLPLWLRQPSRLWQRIGTARTRA